MIIKGVTKEMRREMGQMDWWDHLTDFLSGWRKVMYGMWLGFAVGAFTGHSILTWQWWVVCLPTILLVSIR